MIPELIRISFLGGALALDRSAGWNLMLSQPIVGACLAGALVNPGPEWELWGLRIPIAVGALLQLLLTDPTLPAAQRLRGTATAGVVGSSVALLSLPRLHPALSVSAGGILWVVIGVTAGLFSAVVGGWFERLQWIGSATVRRADGLAESGSFPAFERFYWGGLLRTFLVGAAWTWGGTILFLWAALSFLPRIAEALTARRAGVLFAGLLGAGIAAAYHAHVRGRGQALRWTVLGALVTALFLRGLAGGKP